MLTLATDLRQAGFPALLFGCALSIIIFVLLETKPGHWIRRRWLLLFRRARGPAIRNDSPVGCDGQYSNQESHRNKERWHIDILGRSLKYARSKLHGCRERERNA